MGVLLLLLKQCHAHIWDVFISLIYVYLTNWLYSCYTDVEGYGINKGVATYRD